MKRIEVAVFELLISLIMVTIGERIETLIYFFVKIIFIFELKVVHLQVVYFRQHNVRKMIVLRFSYEEFFKALIRVLV